MLPRAVFAAALAAVCIHKTFSAVPFALNHTELRRTHPTRATNSGVNVWGRRRARDTQIQLTTPLPIQTTSPPLGPYYANYSLVGQEVECSDDAKRCLAINRLIHEPSGICYELGDSRPCGRDGGRLILDVESFRRGQLRSMCSEQCSCKSYNMAYDGKCYESSEVFEYLCDNQTSIVLHPFGGYECNTQSQEQVEVKAIRQPESPGRCVVPSLQNNDSDTSQVHCTAEEEECIQGELYPFRGTCYVSSNTPCPEGQWTILDVSAVANGRLSAKCVYPRPCASDEQQLRAEGSCRNTPELSEKLCNGYYISPNQSLDSIFSVSHMPYEVQRLKEENDLSEDKLPTQPYSMHGSTGINGMQCVMNDKNKCQHGIIPPNSKPNPAG